MRERLYSSGVRSSMLQGSETWPVRNENKVALQGAEMKMVRWMCGVKLEDRSFYEYVLNAGSDWYTRAIVHSLATDRGGIIDEFLSLGDVELLHFVLLKLLLTLVQQQRAEIHRLTRVRFLRHVQLPHAQTAQVHNSASKPGSAASLEVFHPFVTQRVKWRHIRSPSCEYNTI